MLYEKVEGEAELYRVRIREASEAELAQVSAERGLSLNLREMRLVQNYFKRVGRDATDAELEAIAQTWSEHCGHKTFKSEFTFIDENGREEKISSLFKSLIAKATKDLNKDWCWSVFEDNAGVIDFERDYALAFKVETHNHPSALEPFGGAATGVGGVIRDVLGVWADPIANTDVLCFAPLDFEPPEGVKHPRFLYSGVVAGIGAYGNNMGIPTVNGAIFFDESYAENPLVYCGTLGLVPKSGFVKATKAGDAVLLVGGKTGRDGIHGVTFASAELHEKSEETSRSAVQIGDPIEEEKMKRGILRVRDARLASGITDLGGGGLSSAVSEMASRSGLGVEVDLSAVPLKYPIRAPWEIWVSESQERMLLSVPKKNLGAVRKIFDEEEVEATVIGEFVSSRKLVIKYGGAAVAELEMDFLFAQPTTKMKAIWKPPSLKEPVFEEPKNLADCLKKILASPNVCSKESVVRTYDHEVKGHTVLKPFQGVFFDSPGDASVLKPLPESWQGAVLSNGLNPEYGKIDAYWMAANAIDEAIRNNVAVGGRRIALLDNFCWGDPNKNEQATSLYRACKACYDYALAYGTPFISGKDSLYNESKGKPITPTLLISALGVIPDVRNAVTMDAKKAGDAIYLVGETKAELGGSHYYKILGKGVGASVPKPDAAKAKKTFDALTKAIDARLVRACHDLSEGGLTAAAAEMAFAGDLGIGIDLGKIRTSNGVKRNDFVLFSESPSRFLVEVEEGKASEFEGILAGVAFARIGEVIQEKSLRAIGLNGKTVLETPLAELKKSWQGGLK